MRAPEWLLRLGLGVMYLYSGIDIVRHPDAWSWAIRQLPDVIEAIPKAIGVEIFLKGQGIVEIIFAAVFLLWFMPRALVRIVAFLSALEMLAITLLVGVDAVTFRDIGLIGASLALSLIAGRRY
ncbi:MAG: hypothetical protein G01um101472_447 [Parcubacteria group bacterium Gr01-1014_72]|nr:MAG: hypothetical protein G01um101472_447 [Parcubacteria group bacterium Gr01-1014_72]